VDIRTLGAQIYNNVMLGCGLYENQLDGPNYYYNNTIVDQFINVRFTNGSEFKNNIVYTQDASQWPLDVHADGTSAVVTNNLWYNSASTNRVQWDTTEYDSSEQAAWQAAGHTGGLFVDPQFTDIDNDVVTIPKASPARDAGTDVSIADDYIYTARPVLGGFDMGAYEYDPALPFATRRSLEVHIGF
jgi:hypothetical protein